MGLACLKYSGNGVVLWHLSTGPIYLIPLISSADIDPFKWMAFWSSLMAMIPVSCMQAGHASKRAACKDSSLWAYLGLKIFGTITEWSGLEKASASLLWLISNTKETDLPT